MDSNQNPTRLASLEVGLSGDNFNLKNDDISLGKVKIYQVSDILMSYCDAATFLLTNYKIK